MEKIRVFIDELSGLEHIIIDRGNDEYTAMLKSTWDELEAAKEASGTLS